MIRSRRILEAEFQRIWRLRGPGWIETVIRPLQLPGQYVTVRDIPDGALRSIVQLFGTVRQHEPGILAR